MTENVKNILLVMSSQGYLVPPSKPGSGEKAEPAKEELWVETWKRLDRFSPGLFAELFPEEAAKPRKSREKENRKEKAPSGDAVAPVKESTEEKKVEAKTEAAA